MLICVHTCPLAQFCPTLCNPMDCSLPTPLSMEFSRGDTMECIAASMVKLVWEGGMTSSVPKEGKNGSYCPALMQSLACISQLRGRMSALMTSPLRGWGQGNWGQRKERSETGTTRLSESQENKEAPEL